MKTRLKYTDLKLEGITAKNFYQRGCTDDDATKDYDNGCVTTAKSGKMCYKGCTGSKCNNDLDLTNSAPAASFSFIATFFYMFA